MKSAVSTRYGDLMGLGPNLRWDRVTPPDFLESYSKYPWAYMSVWSPMILMEFLLAPTVPSDPNPQNKQRFTSGPSVTICSSTSKEVKETSSLIPIVK